MKLPEKLLQELKSYVYFLQDPITDEIFYVGRGTGDRILHHATEAKLKVEGSTKINNIQKIWSKGGNVNYYILRYGLDEAAAIEVEAAVIDLLLFKKINLSNRIRGGGSSRFGLMDLTALVHQHDEEFLDNIPSDFVAININKRFKRWSTEQEIYEMVRQSWVIDQRRIGDPDLPKLKYVLAEVRGLIIAVFTVSRWYQVQVSGKRQRWAFEGKAADPDVAGRYLHRTLKKKQGAAFPLTYHREKN